MTEKSSRIKKLTFRAMEAYEKKVEDFKNVTFPLFREIEILCQQDIPKGDINSLQAVESNFVRKFDVLKASANNFSDYLSRTCTMESNVENMSLKKKFSIVDNCANQFLKTLEESMKEILEEEEIDVASVMTEVSHISEQSMKMQVEAEAARAKVFFAEREAELLRKRAEFEEQEAIRRAVAERRKADIQTELRLLKSKEEEAIAVAKSETLGTVGSNHSMVYKTLKSTQSPHEKVSKFLKKSEEASQKFAFDSLKLTKSVPEDFQSELQTFEHKQQDITGSLLIPSEFAPPPTALPGSSLQRSLPVLQQPSLLQESVNDFGKYLLKKELLLNRLYRYDEKCENYLMWKTSFRTVMSELDVTAFEELDLNIKWLGPESSRQASSIRAACAGNVDAARSRIWDRLDERYGAAERVEMALRQRLHSFPRLGAKDSKALYDLYDTVSEINFLKDNPKYVDMLSFYDTSYGVSPIVAKLPLHLQERWTVKASDYKIRHNLPYPPFSVFVEFLNLQCKMKNDPSFVYEVTSPATVQKRSQGVKVNKLNVEPKPKFKCSVHNSNSHSLASCRDFKKKSYNERKKILKDNFLCFKCLDAFHGSCKKELKCSECGNNHHTAMHYTSAVPSRDGGESQPSNRDRWLQGVSTQSNGVASPSVNNSCIKVCGSPGFVGKSCAKIVLVEVSSEQTGLKMKTYALIDDQSNRSLASPKLLDSLNVKGDVVEYSVNTCNGIEVKNGRRAIDIVVKGMNENSVSFVVPSILECEVPNNRDEIPTPEVALSYHHLESLAQYIPPVDPSCDINILIGRDVIDAHHVIDQKIGAKNMPYAHKLPLGWVIVGETCLGSSHITSNVNVNKTYIVGDGRASILPPCPSQYYVSEKCEEHDENIYIDLEWVYIETNTFDIVNPFYFFKI